MIDALLFLLAAAVGAALTSFGALWWSESRQPRMVCLLYHRFATPERYATLSPKEQIYTVTTDRLDAQLERLGRAGCHYASAEEAVDFVLGRRELPQPAVLLTVDDGSVSVLHHAVPLLELHGARATLFLTTDASAPVFREPDAERRLDEAELAGLDPGVIDVQAHGVTHRPLVTLDDAELERELVDARADVERLVGRSCGYLAIPGNWHDRRVREAARRAGYRGVFVSDAGGNRRHGDPHRIRRINVDGCDDDSAFAALLTPLGAAQARAVSILKRLPGRWLGPRRWLPIRAALRARLRPETLSFRGLARVALAAVLLAAAVLTVLLLVGGAS